MSRHVWVTIGSLLLGCGNIAIISHVDASRDGASRDAAAPSDAETAPPDLSCTSSADCPGSTACFFQLCRSCPPAGVCKPYDPDNGAMTCPGGGPAACACDGSFSVESYSLCPAYAGYTLTPSMAGDDCNDGGAVCE